MAAPLNGTIETGRMKSPEEYHKVIEPSAKFYVPEGDYPDHFCSVSVHDLADLTPATATQYDVLNGYTGVSAGVNIVGALVAKNSIEDYIGVQKESTGEFTVYAERGVYIEESETTGFPTITVPQDVLADLGGIKPEIVAKNRSDLGIYGTYGADATAKPNDIRAGKIGYVNGVRVVGTLRTNPATNFYIVASGSDSVIITWDNPIIGPYHGVRIHNNIEDNIDTASLVYEGYGSNDQAGGTSSVSIEGLEEGLLYYFYFESYSGGLDPSPTVKLSFRFNGVEAEE